jgi:hypothetical protein
MRMCNVKAAIFIVNGAIFNVRSAVFVLDGFGRDNRWGKWVGGVGSPGHALSGNLWPPTLDAMKLRQGWGTRVCGWDGKSKSQSESPCYSCGMRVIKAPIFGVPIPVDRSNPGVVGKAPLLLVV